MNSKRLNSSEEQLIDLLYAVESLPREVATLNAQAKSPQNQLTTFKVAQRASREALSKRIDSLELQLTQYVDGTTTPARPPTDKQP